MEEKTDALLALLANAALTTCLTVDTAGPSRLSVVSSTATPTSPISTFVVRTPTAAAPVTPTAEPTPRALPRFSVPADLSDFFTEDTPISVDGDATLAEGLPEDIDDLDWLDSDEDSMPSTPTSIKSLYSQASLPRYHKPTLDEVPLEPCTPALSAFYDAPMDMDDFFGAAIPDSPLLSSALLPPAAADERKLRSRWSSSTLATLAERDRTSRWMERFKLKSPTRSTFGLPKPAVPSPTKKTPTSSPSKKPVTPPRPSREVRRRESNVSLSSDSGDSVFSNSSGTSTASNGLRRKPIPVEIFMRV